MVFAFIHLRLPKIKLHVNAVAGVNICWSKYYVQEVYFFGI